MLLIALQVLNLSTDAINFQPMQTSNLTEFNDLNTITEYVTEVVLGYKNFFPESASPDHQKQNQAQKHITIKLYNPSVHHIDPNPLDCFSAFQIPSNENATFRFSRDINPPPNLSQVFIS
jgi:hypothetical protein